MRTLSWCEEQSVVLFKSLGRAALTGGVMCRIYSVFRLLGHSWQ